MSRTLDALRQSTGDRAAHGRDPGRDASEDSLLASLGYPSVPPPRHVRRRGMGIGAILLGLAVVVAFGAMVWYGSTLFGWLPRTAPARAVITPAQPAAPAPTPVPVAAASGSLASSPALAPEARAPLVVPPPAPLDAVTRAEPPLRDAAAPRTPAKTGAPPVAVAPAAPHADPPPRRNPAEADHFNRGLYYHRIGDFENALVQYRAVLEADELNVEAHNNIGLLYLDKKLFDEAIRAFRRATLIDETYDKAHNNLGIALLNSGKPDAAVAEFRRVVAQAPRNVEALSNLGTALKAVGRAEEAREVLQRAIALQTTYAPAHYNLALIYEESGDLVRAIQHYESFLASAGADHANLAADVRTRVQQLKAKLI